MSGAEDTVLPVALGERVERVLGAKIGSAAPIRGGAINQAVHVRTIGGGDAFVKWNAAGLPGLFAAEVDGLRRLRAAGALRVPEVLAFDDSLSGDTPPFLVLEYIAREPPRDAARFARRFGEGLASLHRENVAPDGGFGLERDNYLGVFVQRNAPPLPRWPDFYRDRRLIPQIALARSLGRLNPARERLLEEIVGRIDALLADLDARPALLHGDLWSGNFLAAGDEPVLLDPALCYGEREVEIAYVELFGGFPAGFLPAYHAAFPLDPGYERRRSLHQLYPLLAHLNHFGERYGLPVEEACRRSLA